MIVINFTNVAAVLPKIRIFLRYLLKFLMWED